MRDVDFDQLRRTESCVSADDRGARRIRGFHIGAGAHLGNPWRTFAFARKAAQPLYEMAHTEPLPIRARRLRWMIAAPPRAR